VLAPTDSAAPGPTSQASTISSFVVTGWSAHYARFAHRSQLIPPATPPKSSGGALDPPFARRSARSTLCPAERSIHLCRAFQRVIISAFHPVLARHPDPRQRIQTRSAASIALGRQPEGDRCLTPLLFAVRRQTSVFPARNASDSDAGARFPSFSVRVQSHPFALQQVRSVSAFQLFSVSAFLAFSPLPHSAVPA
jgi:hypothetical protein